MIPSVYFKIILTFYISKTTEKPDNLREKQNNENITIINSNKSENKWVGKNTFRFFWKLNPK